MPRAQGPRFRTVNPEPDFLAVAAEAAASTLRLLNLRLNEAGLTLHFVEPSDAPTTGPIVGFAGFFSTETPDRIYIVKSWVPLDALSWLVAHETGHAGYYALHGDDGTTSPDEIGPSELFADTIADRLFERPPSLGLPGTRHVLPGVRVDGRVFLDTEAMITVKNPGGTVVIDGSSNMFKIAATGTLATGTFAAAGNPGATNSVNLATGLTVTPAYLGFLELASGIAYATQYETLANDGTALDWYELRTQRVNTNQTQVYVATSSRRATGLGAYTYRYYVLKEAAF